MAKPIRSLENLLLYGVSWRWVLLAYGRWRFGNASASRKAQGRVNGHWQSRIQDVLDCPDSDCLPRHAEAGRVVDGLVTMHNGVRVGALGYYGEGILNMLVQSRGVHEPQEERVFQEVLKSIEPGGTILELGAYWGFYSLWFASEVADAKCYLVEPNVKFLASGVLNFETNDQRATFDVGYVGSRPGRRWDGIPVLAVDDYCRRRGIDKLSILHADIQGAEREMLAGASDMLRRRAIDYVFISTHSNLLHGQCVDYLEDHGYVLIASADLDNTYSFDGLVVAASPDIRSIGEVRIAQKTSTPPPTAEAYTQDAR